MRHNPQDEDRVGTRNVGLFTVESHDPAENPEELYYKHSPGKSHIM